MKKVKVLIIDNSLDITGAFNAIWYCVLDLKEEFDFTFLIPEESKNEVFLQAQGYTTYKFPMREVSRSIPNNLLYFPALLKNAWRLRNIIARHQIQIVHANDLYNMIGIAGKLTSSYALLTHVRRLPNSFPRIFFNTWFGLHEKYADAIVGVSRACFEKPLSPKSRVIYDRLPLVEKYPPYQVEAPHDRPIKIIYLANYTFGKGQNYAVEALDLVVKKYKRRHLSLTFAGGDFGLEKNREFKAAILSRVKDLGLEPFVTFEDKVTDVEHKLKQYDIALNFSDSESFSYTCLEALHYGVPLIATDSGGPRELFEDKKSGLLVPVKDIGRMAEALVTLSDDAALRQKFSQASKTYVRAKFSQKETSRKLGDLYNSLSKKV